MQFESTYQSCLYHGSSLDINVERLLQQIEIYRNVDHHRDLLDSPFLLEIDEELIELNVRVERLIQRLDPSFTGEYLEGDR